MKWVSAILAMFGGAACGQAADSFPLVCEAYYRANVTQELSPAKILRQVVTIPREPVPEIARLPKVSEAQFADLTLRLSNSRTGSVYVDVLDTHTKKQIVRHLWQFSRPPGNTFGVTGQGFTGLIYVKHPQPGAEPQFFCKVGRENKNK